LLMSILVLAVTCDLPPSFGPEYDDTSRNFISAYPLAAPTLSGNADGSSVVDLSAVWDWSWREKTGTTFEYMTLTNSGTVGTDVTSGAFTLDATETSWRLELANLAGDPYFEDSIPAGWIANAPATMALKSSTFYHGQYLELVSNNNYWVGFNPNFPGFILDAPASNRSNIYRLAAYSTKADIKYLIEDYNALANFDDTIKYNISNNEIILKTFSVPELDTRAMFAVTQNVQTVEIDDLRVVRSDIANMLSLRLRLKPADTEIDLAPGLYEFSVWVKVPTDALSYADSARATDTRAPFSAEKVRLELRQVGFSEEERTTPLFFSESFPTSSTWTRLALRMDGNLDRFERSSKDVVIELAIYPFDVVGTISPGSVLIAAPSLRFFKDGYTD